MIRKLVFAFQPIVDPFACEIISWEALLRTPDGQSPGAYFAGLAGDDIYLADLHSKRVALSLAGKVGLRNKALSINLLPMTLVKAPNAVAFLLDEISRNDLIRSRLLSSSLSGSDFADGRFYRCGAQTEGRGINLAIDHFGAGLPGCRCWRNTNPTELKSTMS
nr:EAL domain-containing protein [Klebsiella variicola]